MSIQNRRHLLLAGAAVIGGMGMGGTSSCSSSGGGIDPALIDKINEIIAGTCNAIGMAASIAAIIAAVFPGLSAATATVAQIAQIAEMFCAAVSKPAAGKYKALVKGTEIEVHGWIIKDNKITQF